MTATRSFTDAVYAVVARIPRGRVMTYAAVAAAAGVPGAARAVGNALNRNRDFARVPCHRVVRTDRTAGGYVGGIAAKRALLAAEGVHFDSDGRVAAANVVPGPTH